MSFFMTEIRKRNKVSGTIKVQSLTELTSSDKVVFKAKALNNNFIESLILAQDERWRRA